MTIGVQSFPELYTMLIGWNLYDQLWDILSKTGIAFLPFVGIVLRNIAKPYESQETKDAASTSLRRMEIDILTTLLIIFLGVSPFLPLDPSKVSYTPLCQSNGDTYHPGDTQSTWDSAFAVPTQTIRVPLWWYAVMSVSEGFASSANTMVTCVPNFRKMVTEVDMSQLQDPNLKEELHHFASDCYIPARTQYFQDSQKNADSIQTINNDRTQFGNDDTEWMGSHSFQDTYYQTLKASQPITGFSYDPNQDINSDTNKDNPPTYGTPNCFTWWNDSQNGLKTRLYAALPKTFADEFGNFFANDPKGVLKDDVIQRLIANSDTGYQKGNDTVGDWGYSHLAESLGSWMSQLTTYPKLYAAAQAAPIIQALLLLMIYTFLPFALVFSGYKPSTFLTGAAILFSMIFWSFIWHLVSYVDSTLMTALYGDSWFAKQSPSATLADMITGTLIIVAPLFWFGFMGAMGVAVGDFVARAFNSMNEVGDRAADEGAKTVKSVTSSVANSATSVAKKLL
jgi:hypothetical protein